MKEDNKIENEPLVSIKRTDENTKYKDLYNEVLNYLESKKPYCNPDFNISQVANALNTNVTYISRAIRLNANTHFKIFINTYRINKVKELIEEDYHSKYNLKYIYSTVGFRHQYTFNKAFKQIEGVTPSEYIKEISKENDEFFLNDETLDNKNE